jgi:alkanesulfonate monooxygenase SsuD/methylene tetrahydromethanopterin reductase-like flavin-dependent oxidoreductase (luciferase family)
MADIKFGFCVPIFANPGMAFFRTPAYKKLDWESIKESVLLCDNLGYDSVFVADHVFLGRDGDIWECLTLMSALAAITSKVDIIPIHLCNNFRSPSMVAKALATLSHVSCGRLQLFYDYGWRKAEFEAYGIPFRKSDEERIRQMGEGLSIIKGMLEEESFSFNGSYYSVKNAICNPKPVRKIPIWMGEANNAEMISSIVSQADVFNSMPCSLAGFEAKKSLIQAECERQGREFSQLGLSLETQILIRESDEEIEEVFESFKLLKELNNSFDQDILAQMKATNPNLDGYNSRKDFEEEFLIGTPATIKEKLSLFVDKGVSHFMLWFMDYPDQKGIKLFAEKLLTSFS